MTMNPVSAAVAGALISGVVMYAVGARTDMVDAFTPPQPPAYVQTVDGRIIPVTPAPQPAGSVSALQPGGAAPLVAAQPVVYREPAPQRVAYRTAPVQERVVARETARPRRSWQTTALVIGGSAATGAGVGGLIDGKNGALIGAAIGGGAASIYEATKR
jgi:hypothetical protein